VAGGQFFNFIGYSSDHTKQEEWQNKHWVGDAEHEELASYFDTFEPEVRDLIKCIDKSSRWAMYDLDPLPFWSKGHVTLLGDAAHATTPFLGSGGGQVLEDAYILANLLGSPLATLSSIPQILKAYEAVRKERGDRVVKCSREACRCLEFLGEYDGASDERAGGTLNKLTEWLWEGNGDPDDDLVRAEEMVKHAMTVEGKKHEVSGSGNGNILNSHNSD